MELESLKVQHDRADEALRVSQDELSIILDNAPIIMFLVDQERRVRRVNRAVFEATGLTAEEIMGLRGGEAFSCLHSSDDPRGCEFGLFCNSCAIRNTVLDTLNTGKSHYKVEAKLTIIRDDKDEELCLLVTTSLLNISNEQRVLVCFEDITERKRMEEELRKHKDHLEELVKERTEELERANKLILEQKKLLERENISLKEEIRAGLGFEEMVGMSDPIKDVIKQIKEVAPTDTTVLIRGETGTGKELVARYIHEQSRRKDRVLVKVNCAALSEGLINSELFGHEKGAFTGAIEKRVGRFEYADKATIFLDEIGDLPLETQAKLLRVIQENEFERVGSSKTIKVDVRIITATNRNLESLIQQGRFRQDLYYRLNVFPIFVPPLRERKEDIPLLIEYFIAKLGPRVGKSIKGVSRESIKLLNQYEWPGNIRELENIIERVLITNQGDILGIDPGLLFQTGNDTIQSTIKSLDDNQRDIIIKALERTMGVIYGKKGAAQLLEIKPSTLHSRMKKLSIPIGTGRKP